MHTLHIVNKSPGHARFRECLGVIGPDDALLLTGNGVVALVDSGTELPQQLYALQDDVQARALALDGISCTTIGFDSMVALTTQAQRVISW